MKARGRYLIGVDFDGNTKHGEPALFAVPMRGNAAMWNHAETVTRDDFEKLMASVERKIEKTKGSK